MKSYTFAPYSRKDAPLADQKDNIIFIMIRQAVMNTPMKADKPSDRAEWKRMGVLIDALEPLELKETSDGKETFRLIEAGGTLVLEDAVDELLWKILDKWMTDVPLGAAKQVNWLMDFKDTATSETLQLHQ